MAHPPHPSPQASRSSSPRTALRAAGAALLVTASAGCVKLPDTADNPFNLPQNCFNDVVDGDETDVDCGGACAPCSAGGACRRSSDCTGGTCLAGRCTPTGSTCFDHARDGKETDVDCGGGCAKCAAGRACAVASDCVSGTCTAGQCAAGSGPFVFADPRFADAGKGATALVVADLDGDGKLDAATANERDDTISVLAGVGDGTLAAGTAFSVDKEPGWIGAADLTEDGRPDLVVLSAGASGFQLLPNRGRLDFGGPPRLVSSATTSRPVAATITDLDGDGHLDVVLSSGAGQLTAFRGQGGGAFDGGSLLGQRGIGPSRLAAADLDGNGRPEVAVVADMIVKVFTDRGEAIDVAPGFSPISLALPVLRAGASRDLVVTTFDGELRVLPGLGNGDFGAPKSSRTGQGPFAIGAADLDGDGKVDLVTCNQGTSDLSLLAGHGDGDFEAPISRWIGGSPQDLVVADMNADGRPDLVVCDYWQHDVGVLLNLAK